MKRFYFKDEVVKVSKLYGNATHKCTIYQNVKGDLIYLGTTDYNSSSCMGAVSEVNKYLIINKFISINVVRKQQKGTSYADNKQGYSYYYYGAYGCKEQQKYKIEEI